MFAVLRNLSLKAKLFGIAGFLLLLLLITTLYSIVTMQSINRELTSVTNQDIPLSRLISQITRHHLEQNVEFERSLHLGELLTQEKTARTGFHNAVQQFDEMAEKVTGEVQKARAFISQSIDKASSADAGELNKVDSALTNILKQHNRFVKLGRKAFVLITQRETHAAEKLAQEIETQQAVFNTTLEQLTEDIEQFTLTSANKAQTHEQQAIVTLSVIAIVSLLFGALATWVVVNFIVNAIRDATLIASGDLTQAIEVNSHDEIGVLLQAINGMREQLLSLLSKISSITEQLSSSSEEMSAITKHSSETMNRQRSEIDQVASAMNEMTATIREVTTNIAATSEAATKASEKTHEGQQVVEHAVKEINLLNEQIAQAAQVTSQVGEQSKTINSVLEVIESIAEQTNLLALNAAIEAARAGDHGRGFSVVADEVRSLARRTQESIEHINKMIDELQAGSKRAVQTIEQSQTRSQTAVDYAFQSGTALGDIAELVAPVTEMSLQIASAAEEQNTASEEINRNIVRITDMVRETATSAEQTSVASRDLAQMASEMQSIVNQFKI